MCVRNTKYQVPGTALPYHFGFNILVLSYSKVVVNSRPPTHALNAPPPPPPSARRFPAPPRPILRMPRARLLEAPPLVVSRARAPRYMPSPSACGGVEKKKTTVLRPGSRAMKGGGGPLPLIIGLRRDQADLGLAGAPVPHWS